MRAIAPFAAAFLALCVSTSLTATLSAQRELPQFVANAEPQVRTALAKAQHDNKRVLLFFGSSTCVNCRVVLDNLHRGRESSRELSYEYETVHVEMGNDSNAGLPERLGFELATAAIPHLTILDAAGEEVAHLEPRVAPERGEELQASLLSFLRDNRAAPLDACQVLADAQARAEQESKRLFIHIGAPWCGWCHRLEDWMAQPEMTELFGTDYIDVKIDQDRMTHGKVVTALLRQGQSGGIPWIVITDARLRPLINSDGPGGNTGFPVQPEEIAHFVKMLRETRQQLSDEGLTKIEESLQARAKEILDARRR